MSTVKISQLPLLTSLNANTANSLFMGVDIPTGTTGKFTAHTLAQGLYSNEILNVGANPVVYEGVIGQFSGNSSTYLQVNLQNFDSTGSSDFVASASDSDNANNYVDMGINGKNFSDQTYSSMKPYDSYVYSHGPSHYSNQGNLVVGTASTGANILFIAGGTRANNIVASIGANGITLNTQSYFTFADGSTQAVAAAPANYTQSAFDTANTAAANTVVTQGVDVTQNTRIQSIETINTNQNNAITIIQGVDLTQNTNIVYADAKAQAAFDAANTVSGRQDRTAIINAEQNNRILITEQNCATLFAFQTQTGVINREQNTSINFAWSNANTALAIANAALANTTVTLNGDLTTTGNIITEFVRATYNSLGDFSPLATFTATPTGTILIPSSPGYIVQVTGKEGVSARMALDSLGTASVPNYLTRHARGVANTPTPSQSGDVIGRYSSFGYGNTVFNAASDARIDITALENFTDTAHGTSVTVFATPIGTNTAVRVINASSGNTGIYSSNTYVSGNLVSASLASFNNVTVNGTMILANSNFSSSESALTISATPTVATPSNDGYMLHISGKEGVPSRIVYDSYGSGAYALVAGRTARGTVASPTAVSNNDVLMRISGNGHGGAGAGWTTTGVARMDIVATENYSATNRGSQIQFWNCAIGSNTLQQIATFNGDSIHFTGVVSPQKGFVFTPNVISSNVTTHTIDFAQDSLKKLQINNDCTVTLSNFVAGKIVEVWVTNLSGSNRTFTHGCSALNSTHNPATATIPATSSAYFKYFSIDGDLANTFVSVIQG